MENWCGPPSRFGCAHAGLRLQGANYRLIDIPVSNCINSDINKIYCLTQFNSASLNRHLSNAYVRRRTYSARPRWLDTDPLSQNANVGSYTRQGFVEVLAAQQSPENPDWFQGTADAVRQYLWLFKVRVRVPPQRVCRRPATELTRAANVCGCGCAFAAAL